MRSDLRMSAYQKRGNHTVMRFHLCVFHVVKSENDISTTKKGVNWIRVLEKKRTQMFTCSKCMRLGITCDEFDNNVSEF